MLTMLLDIRPLFILNESLNRAKVAAMNDMPSYEYIKKLAVYLMHVVFTLTQCVVCSSSQSLML